MLTDRLINVSSDAPVSIPFCNKAKSISWWITLLSLA